MTDPRLLSQELRAYDEAMERQLVAMHEDFDLLQRSWALLRECYEGTAADQFDALWHGTTRRFDDCLERSATLRGVLRDRIEALEEFDRPSAL